MSIKLETEIADLRKQAVSQAEQIAQLEAAVTELQRMLREMTRLSTPKGRAA